MTKEEIITRIINRITDPWTDCPEDYLDSEPLDLEYATTMLKEYRAEDDDWDLELDERMPEEATPELLMEAFNCHVRFQKHELRIERLAEYITDNEMVCEYVNYYAPTIDNPIDMIPVDFLYATNKFPFSTGKTESPSVIDLIRIGMNSTHTFHFNHEFCWFDKDKGTLHSTSHPFRDGILNAIDFARFIMCDAEALGYFLDGIMDEDDIKRVFECTKEELLKEVTH